MQSNPSCFISFRKFESLSAVMSAGAVEVATMHKFERPSIEPPLDRNSDDANFLLLAKCRPFVKYKLDIATIIVETLINIV
jgi:hypothetical protein